MLSINRITWVLIIKKKKKKKKKKTQVNLKNQKIRNQIILDWIPKYQWYHFASIGLAKFSA